MTQTLVFGPKVEYTLRDGINQDNEPRVERKEQAKMCEATHRKRYPSDLTDAQWELIESFIPKVSSNATVPTIERREIVNAILYVLRTGCSWRQMPHDLPNAKAAHHYFCIWIRRLSSATQTIVIERTFA